MGRLLPLRGEPETTPGEARVLDLDDDATGEALSALSSETSRAILQALYERPRTPPELREEVGTSLQNVHYHLERLTEADLIEPAGTGYSEKGNEMTVYGPASRAVVLFAGDQRERSRLVDFLKRALGAVVLLAAASGLVRYLLDRFGPNSASGGYQLTSRQSGGGGDAAAGGAKTATEAAAASGSKAPAVSAGKANATFDAASEPVTVTVHKTVQQPPLDPAVAFFLGGVFVLVVVGVWYYYSRR
ncbi:MAG: ArsR/SmtB family transcription factor [Haloarculaceae archaeon]